MVPASATAVPEIVPAPEYVADGNWCLSVPALSMAPKLERVPELVNVRPDGIVSVIPELIVSVSPDNMLKGKVG